MSYRPIEDEEKPKGPVQVSASDLPGDDDEEHPGGGGRESNPRPLRRRSVEEITGEFARKWQKNQ